MRLKRQAISPAERDFLERMFVPLYYARVAGLSANTSRRALFRHFLSQGLARGISPSPLFEPEVFREREGVPDPALRDVPDVLRWCRTRLASGIVPTTRFDPVFYLQSYEEVAEAGVNPFEHFIRFGLAERRRPNGIFDPEFYESTARRQSGEGDVPAYIHFLVFGVERGCVPSSVLATVLARTGADRVGGIAAYDRAVAAITPWVHSLGTGRTTLLLGLFHPYLYDGDGALNSGATGLDRLVHFLQEGLEKGIDPGPLFDSAYYSNAANLPMGPNGKPAKALLHFLNEGSNARLVPTELFDAAAYIGAWADMRDPAMWGFGHFLSAGIYEGRRIDGSERVDQWTRPLDTAQGLVHNWQLFWDEAGYPAPRSYDALPEAPLSVDAATAIKTDLSANDLAFVRALFVPEWYAREAAQDPATPGAELLAHYLSTGIDANLSPSPLFEPEVALHLTRADPAASAMRAWLARRKPNWPAPSRLIDVHHYRQSYAELRGGDLDPYEHFIVHGLREQRAPNPLFDPVWYDQAYERPAEETQLPAYIHYLLFGADRGLAPSRLLLPVFAYTGASDGTTLADYQRLAVATRPLAQGLTPDQLQAVFAFFMPYTYDGGGALGDEASGIERLIDFLDRGFDAGLSPGPFFDSQYYTETRIGGKFFASRRGVPFFHYLKHGWPKRFVPNDIFDEEVYRSSQPDIKAQKVWGFRHFLNHGIFEGRKIGIAPSLTIWPRANDIAGSQLSNWLMFWAGHNSTTPSLGLPGPVLAQQKRLVEFVKSELFDEIIQRAQTLDPALGEPRKLAAIYAAPYHDQLADVMDRLYERIPDRYYDSIITVPWLRTGGADLVACQLAGALKEAWPEKNVLILRVDQKNLERPDWIPEGVDQVHVSDLLNFISPENAETLLYALFLGLAPKRILNVNSYKVWRTFERYGNRLGSEIALYGYLFCWDQTPEGLRVGYPSMFYAGVSPHLAGMLTDTDYLREELIKLYRPPADVAARTMTLHTPSRTEPTKRTCAEVAAERRVGKRPRVLWAGRLDRQKRFDLVQEIARRMPHADFHCWGDAVLDSPPDLGKSPRNLVLNPGFKDYAELPFEDADLWLFTSAWEGMPTILIEIAVRGMSVVASQVGGVPELVTDDTGFAVHDVDAVDAYVSAVQFAIDNPVLRIERAKKLQARAIERYTRPSYVRQLKEIVERES